jgi:hypothetical protein
MAKSQQYEPNYPHIGKGIVDVYLTIVIGSMQEIANAEKLAAKAQAKGFSTEIQAYNKGNILLNRVCVGKTQSRAEANKLLREVKAKMRISNAWILEFPFVTPFTENEIQKIKQEEIVKEQKNIQEENERLEAQKKHEQETFQRLKEEEQKRLEALKKADQEQLEILNNAMKAKIEAEKQKALEEKQIRLKEEELIRLNELEEKERKIAEKIAEKQKLEDEKLAEEQRLLAEKEKLEAEKAAELKRLETEKIAEEQRLKAEKEKLEAEKLAELKRLEAEKIAEQNKIQQAKLDSVQKSNELSKIQKNLIESAPKSEQVGAISQFQTIDNDFVNAVTDTSKAPSAQSKELNPQQKNEFLSNFKIFIEALRNYEYKKANEFISPKNHLFVFFNETSNPSVREFPSFEKFFAVFSAFTSKGTSYDFSLDIELFFKETFGFKDLPEYNCETKNYSKQGTLANNINSNDIGFTEIAKNYFTSGQYEKPSEMTTRINELDMIINVQVMSTKAGFIEGFYFGFLDGKWYLLVLDLRTKCK